jgi:D-beta-D-heptose 7-phosphate kinase/D-beta-D-heptose 1-phosphate adenosyltransferase
MSLDELLERIEGWRRQDLRLAVMVGAFDLPHAGHVRRLRAARAQADRLLLAVEDDPLASRSLGEGQPVSPATDRARVVAALRGVDAVVLLHGPDERRALTALLRTGELVEDVHSLDREHWRQLRG